MTKMPIVCLLNELQLETGMFVVQTQS